MNNDHNFEYNDEFFFDDVARTRATKTFSAIWFALYSSRIADEFKKHDDVGRKLKSEFQLWGFLVVGLAVLALSLAAIEPTFVQPAIDAGVLPVVVRKAVG